MITIYIAVDIGKRNCVVCITDKDGSILEETKYENTLQEACLLLIWIKSIATESVMQFVNQQTSCKCKFW